MNKTKGALFVVSLAFGIVLTNCGGNPYQQGEILYANYCANCHMDDGSGLGGNIPTLVNADYIAKNREQLACIIRYGIADTIVVNGITYAEAMAGHPKLKEAEIANILNYIIHTWNEEVAELNMKEITEGLAACEE
ncbi:MAG: cytochrome c [Bacteroidota bacterium]